MVQLNSGMVLAAAGDDEAEVGAPTQLFDPATGSEGSWSLGPSAMALPGGLKAGGFGIDTMVLLGGDLCVPNCGRVLAHIKGHPGYWELYDPASNSWSPSPSSALTRNHYARATQIRGSVTECGANCGKVLIAGQGSEGYPELRQTPPTAELYDPKTNTFTIAGNYAAANEVVADPLLAPLPDGRVLLVGKTGGQGQIDVEGAVPTRVSRLFDPLTGTFSDAAVPSMDHFGSLNDPVVFQDGSVLADGNEIYKPGPRDSEGSWSSVSPCGTTGSCLVMATLEDGRVLANGDAEYRPGSSRDMFLFDPQSRGWTQTGSLNAATSAGTGVLLSKQPCGTNCGKVLIAATSAELYTKP